MILCEVGGFIPGVDRGKEVKNAGGAPMILLNREIEGFTPFAAVHVLPPVYLSYVAGLAIKEYINLTANPKATI